MPSVELLAVGTELLLGQLVDTNTPHVAAAMADNGIDVFGTGAVGDNRARIAERFRHALTRADGVISTGGLGPTIDDLTKEAVCDVLGVGTERHEEAVATMQQLFARIGRAMRDNNLKQADLPAGARLLENEHGSAPGFFCETRHGKFIACMPGVPHEMKPMLAGKLLPLLRERFSLNQHITTRILHTLGIAESEIDHRIADLFQSLENPKIAVLAHDFRCDVKIMAKAASQDEAARLIDPVAAELRQRLDGFIFGEDGATPASAVHELLQMNKETLAVAESCTGGHIGAALTAVAGSSKSFLGDVVAYDNSVKSGVLHVPSEEIARYGAVSREVAASMAAGARERTGATWAVSTTGIAGPDGGSTEKPVGLVWFGLNGPGVCEEISIQFAGARSVVQARATTYALGLLWRRLSQRNQ